MVDLVQQKSIDSGFKCSRCFKVVKFKTETFEDIAQLSQITPADYPGGYYFTLRRVTDAKHHKQTTSLIYVCSKDCLIGWMMYEISSHTIPVQANEWHTLEFNDAWVYYPEGD